MKRISTLAACLVALLLFCLPAFSAELYFAEFSTGKVKVFDTNTNTVKEFASGLKEPFGVAFLQNGDLLVSSAGEGKVIKISPTGAKSTFASGIGYPVGIAVASDGTVYVADFKSSNFTAASGKGSIWKIPPGGAKVRFVDGIIGPADLAIDSGGNLLATNYAGGSATAVYKISTTGEVSTHLSNAGLLMPYGLAPNGDQLAIGVYGTGLVLFQGSDGVAFGGASGTALRGVMGLCLADGTYWYVNMRRGTLGKIGIRLGGLTGTPLDLATGLSQPTGVAVKP